MNESEHLDTSTCLHITEVLELYTEEIRQTFSFVELAMEVKDDLRSCDYFKIALAHLPKAVKIIADLNQDYPSHANVWALMRNVVKAYDDQVSHAFEWNQYIRNPSFDLTIPQYRSKNQQYIRRNRRLASLSNKLELQVEKLLRALLE